MKFLEKNRQKKKWKEHLIKFALCYPNEYRAGISNLGIQLLYFLLNDNPEIICERFFLPKSKKRTPLSIESSRPLRDFDIIGFTLQYENDYYHVLSMIKSSGIPIESTDRGDDFPVIMAGGPTCTNPIPLKNFIDLFLIGDYEPIHEEFMNILMDSRNKGEFLENVKQIPSIYVPSNDTKEIKKSVIRNLDSSFHPIMQIVPLTDSKNGKNIPFQDSMLVEVSRGCLRNCNFCMIGWQAKPFRKRSLKKLKTIILDGMEINQVKKVILIGAGISDHPDLVKLCEFMNENSIQFSLPSLRVDKISENLLETLNLSGSKTLTLAFEAGSSRLREKINKNIDDEKADEVIRLIKKHGVPNLKLYFMIGLPTETIEDVKQIAELYSKINLTGYSTRNLKISVNPFIPKPHTPFQWHQMPENKYFNKVFKLLDKTIPVSQIENQEARYSFIQGCLSLGGEEFNEVLKRSLVYGYNLGSWRRIFKELKMAFRVPRYLETEELPWNFINVGINKDLLMKRWKHVISKA
ncbi:MAG: radical SAM protein [Candidatus Helarchaeota archaeon]